MNPSVTDGDERQAQRRLLSVALAGPFLVSAAVVQVLTPSFGMPLALAVTCTTFVLGWTAAVAVAQSGSRRIAGPALLLSAMFPVVLLIASGGGAASPFFLSFLPLALEPYYVSRTKRAFWTGGGAAAVALAAGLLGAWSFAASAGPAAVWYWFVPLIYLATFWLRRDMFLVPAESAPEREATLSFGAYRAVLMRMSRNGDVVECSPEARSILAVEPDFLFGSGLFDRIHVADRIAYLGAVADLREGCGYRRIELRLRLPTATAEQGADTYRPFALELVRDESVPDGFFAILRENSEVASLRNELHEAQERAEMEKLRFLATVSHELRTPLNAIIGFSDMLLTGIAGPFANEQQREYTSLVRESGEHLLSVVNAILDVAKIEAGTYPVRKEDFCLRDAVETSRAIMSYQASAKQVEIECELDDALATVFADRRALQQILINLLSNGVKFTPAGGKVRVRATRDGSGLDIVVSDTGIGMEKDDLVRIGKPFVQVANDQARQYEGTGLGLSLVRGLVELQGGSMAIESAPGLGTSVEIKIPCDDRIRLEDRYNAEILSIPPTGKQRRKADDTLRRSA